MSQEKKQEYPNEVAIPFLNPISEKFHIVVCENDPNAGNGRHRYCVFAIQDGNLVEVGGC